MYNMKIYATNPAKQARQEARLYWIRKYGWIVQTVISGTALIISIIVLISKL